MGTSIPPKDPPPDVPEGSPCVNCWGPGKPFGNGETPSTINVVLSGIEKGPDWGPGSGGAMNGEYVLDQVVGLPCGFQLDIIPFAFIFVLFLPGETQVGANNQAMHNAFTRNGASPCSTVLANEEDEDFTGGVATITIPEVI